jgi:hypothetical protein
MLSTLIHAPEFAAPLPRWAAGAALALSLVLLATLVCLPLQEHPGTAAAHATFTR